MQKKKAIEAIRKNGVLLVFPINNAPEPRSLWSCLHPRSEMRWEWDEGGDNRVAELWHLREELSRSKKVVYAKWYRGRATFFSREIFKALFALYSQQPKFRALSREARELLELLMESSPQSTKQLKRGTGLVGRALEPTYQKALQELWNRLLIVAFGEIEEGAFPSLAVGASQLLFEDLCEEAKSLSREEALAQVEKALSPSPLFLKYALKILDSMA